MALETDSDLEFEFFLTQKLGHPSVEIMRDTIGNREYVGWVAYYGKIAQQRELERQKMRR